MPHPTKKGEPRAPCGPLGPGLCSLPTASPLPRTGWGRAAAGDPSPPGVGGRILLTPTATQTGQRLGRRGTRGGCQDVSAEVPLAKIHPLALWSWIGDSFQPGLQKGHQARSWHRAARDARRWGLHEDGCTQGALSASSPSTHAHKLARLLPPSPSFTASLSLLLHQDPAPPPALQAGRAKRQNSALAEIQPRLLPDGNQRPERSVPASTPFWGGPAVGYAKQPYSLQKHLKNPPRTRGLGEKKNRGAKGGF